MSKKFGIVFIFLLGLVHLDSFAALEYAKNHVDIQILTDKDEVKAGEEFNVLYSLDIHQYWYTYDFKEQVNDGGIGPTTTEIFSGNEELLVINGDVQTPKPYSKMDEGFEMEVKYFKGNVDFVVPIKAVKDFKFSENNIQLGIFLQVCDTTRCLNPEEVFASVKAKSIDAADIKTSMEYPYKDKEKKKDKISEKNDNSTEEDESLFDYFIFAMLMGFGALSTPCVFPMIPITVSFFTKRAENQKTSPLKDASLYIVGIITTFTLIGVLLAILLGSAGIQNFAVNPWVNLTIAIVFIALAFSLFGSFEIQLPTSIMNKLNAKSNGTGPMAVIFMGITFSITSFTCTVAFVATVLAQISSGEAYLFPIVGTFGFALAFSLPFFFLALFPSTLAKLPKSGGWMNNIKVVFGFIEIAAAVKFLSGADLYWQFEIFTREVILAIWIACGLLIVIYLLGKYQMKLDSTIDRLSGVRLMWTLVFTSTTIYLVTGLFGARLGELESFFPPAGYGGSGMASIGSSHAGADPHANWLQDYDQAYQKAKSENKKLFVDFTGWNCTNCRWMESNMFPKPEVTSLMNDFVKVQLYTDGKDESSKINQQHQIDKYQTNTLPYYVIIDPNNPDQEVLDQIEFTRDKEAFIKFLKSGIN